MQLTVRDLTEMFNVSETTVTRWVRQQKLPAQKVAGQLRFNRLEVLDWAIAHRVKAAGSRRESGAGSAMPVSLTDALQAGGIHYDVPGEGPEAVLRTVVLRLPLPDDLDRESLLRLFLARETLGSTALGDGIAIPHARRPVVLHVPRSLVTLCFLKHPVASQADAGLPVRIHFSVISPTVAAHVQLLTRLSHALSDPAFRNSVVDRKPRQVILREARRFEKAEQEPKGSRPQAA